MIPAAQLRRLAVNTPVSLYIENEMNRFQNYSKQLIWTAILLLTASVAGCGGSDSSSNSDSAPTVVSTSPSNDAKGVAYNDSISASFSGSMNSAMLTSATFTLTGPGTTKVSGAVSYSDIGATATLAPMSHLAANTKYTATVTTGAQDKAGQALASDFVWTFTTGASANITAPTVVSESPADAVSGVAINTNVSAAFSEAVAPATLTAARFTLTGAGATLVAGTVTYAPTGNAAIFTPAANLAANTKFTATIAAGVKDQAGNALASDFVWTFTTGAAADNTDPMVSSTAPANNATGAAINGAVTATFDEAMNPATISSADFLVTGPGSTKVSGAVSYLGTTATFKPAANLAPNTAYTATLTTQVLSLTGNPLASAYIWTFTTGTALAAGPLPVVLGTAGNYVILSKSGISTVPTSAVTGNIGVSPIDSTGITGFSLTLDASVQFATSAQVTGKVYAPDYSAPTPSNLTTAVSNMQTAYTDAAGRAPDATELGAGNIGGLTIAPGVYKWSSGVTIPSNLTLSGGANDVWIFQIAGDVTVASAVKVILAGGAVSKNVFWQIAGGSGLTLGTGAHFEGIVLAQTAITLGSGASVNGRLLAQTAVHIDGSKVTQPAP
jgi:hypothetical protein